MPNQAFWYVDGIPTKGMWIDMDDIDDHDEVLELLAEAGYCAADYGGDLLVADAEGLCYPFMGSYGTFDLDGFVDCRDHDGDEDAKAAYVRHLGDWSRRRFEEAYLGHYDSDTAFAEEYIEMTGMLNEIPEALQNYFDYEAFARDLMMDHFSENGYYFRVL